MKQITFYLDFISPYAYLAFERLPQALEGISYNVIYRPVLFAGLLQHHGQLGPAEIAPKRDWTYRHVLWLAHSLGIPMQMPASHPFNPLALLRLAIACGAQSTGDITNDITDDIKGRANRYVCENIFHHVWRGGRDAADLQRFNALAAQLRPPHDVEDGVVKASLKKNTEDAIELGVFGVPGFVVDDKVFWGLDGLPMLRDYLCNGSWFASGKWKAAPEVFIGASRKKSS